MDVRPARELPVASDAGTRSVAKAITRRSGCRLTKAVVRRAGVTGAAGRFRDDEVDDWVLAVAALRVDAVARPP